ncbi:MAG: hypothetical protein ACLFU2_02685 [Opitutales bacterium]
MARKARDGRNAAAWICFVALTAQLKRGRSGAPSAVALAPLKQCRSVYGRE